MKIKKRNGELVEFNPNKILTRLKSTAKGLKVDYTNIAIEVQSVLYDNITTKQIDEEIARISASYSVNHPDYSYLASKITASRLQKELGTGVESWKNRLESILPSEIFIKQAKWEVEPDYSYDFTLDFIGISTFITVYGTKINKKTLVELPTELMFRVALFLSESKEEFEERYNDLITREYGTATPVFTNAGTSNNTMISCSVNELMDDSLEGIHDTLKSISQMSKSGSGIGLWASNLRSMYTSYSNKGKAGGIQKLAKIVNEHLRFFKQNEDRRGKCALYNNIWHRDIFEFLDLAKKEGSEETTARDLLLAIGVNDLFWKRLIKDQDWSLFCPHEIKKYKNYNLYDFHGAEFEERYLECENDERLNKKVVSSKELMEKIGGLQVSAGIPYIFNIDNTNAVNNQENYGIIKMMQLCIEICQFTDSKTSAQCCLGSIILAKYIKNGKIDYEGIRKASLKLNYTLNRVLDRNEWVNEYAYNGGYFQRATAIGMCGLADLLYQLKVPFESEEAKIINRQIAENIYYGAIEGSIKYRKENNIPKEVTDLIDQTNVGKGIFVFEKYNESVPLTLDWNELRKEVLEFGVSNSMFIADMPTATSASLASVNEMFEPIQDLAMVRETVAGSFAMLNKHMIKDLEEKGIFSDKLMLEIKSSKSLKEINLEKYTEDLEWINNFRNLYKTVWEISQKKLIELSAIRQRFTDQSQSLNLYWEEPTLSKITNAMIYGWQQGLKTGVYYTKTRTKLEADKKLGIQLETEKPKDSLFDCLGCSA